MQICSQNSQFVRSQEAKQPKKKKNHKLEILQGTSRYPKKKKKKKGKKAKLLWRNTILLKGHEEFLK